MNEWFKAKKLSINTKKQAFSLYYESAKKDNLHFALPILTIDDVDLKRKISTKFFGVLLDENLTWKDHISTIENKISKNIE